VRRVFNNTPSAENSKQRMRAIIVSAGQGRRLLPLTADTPKCLLPVLADQTLLEVQLQALNECGVHDVSVMVGFGADKVEARLADHCPPGMTVRCCYNPFYNTSDNLITVWLARSEMRGDFILLNGDTLFETAVLRRLLASPPAPLTMAIDIKAEYDDDDMKVSLQAGARLGAVGKTLKREVVNGESIGLMCFREANGGVEAFRRALDAAVRNEESVHSWYLAVINDMTDDVAIDTCSIEGLWWGEVDSREDLMGVRSDLEQRSKLKGDSVRREDSMNETSASQGIPR
jgi:choline kinase